MEVILLKDIKTLGKEGDAVKVKEGYARNYLIPNKLALPSTKGALRVVEAKKKKREKEKENEKKIAGELAKKISQVSLTISVESGVNDTLFGSVTNDTIFYALKDVGISVDKKDIIIKEPIRKLGVYTLEVKLHSEVKGSLRIWVVKK